MAIYRPTTGTGTWTSPGSAYDINGGTTGNLSTYSSVSMAGNTTATETWSWTTSVTGITAVKLYVAYTLECYDWNTSGGSFGTYGLVNLQYSHNGGTNYYTLVSDNSGGIIGNGTTYETFTLTNLPANLSSLRFRAFVRGGTYNDGEVWDGSSNGYIYDVYADVNPITARPNTSCDPFIFF